MYVTTSLVIWRTCRLGPCENCHWHRLLVGILPQQSNHNRRARAIRPRKLGPGNEHVSSRGDWGV
eukprot:6200204-Pleurochrysis_carterae.AAC.4